MGLWSWLRGTPPPPAQPPGEGPSEADDARLVDEAVRRLQQGDPDGARALLEGVVSRTPADYRHEFEQGGRLHVKFWDMADFLGYAAWAQAAGVQREVVWVLNAYPRARFYLGYLDVERGDLSAAVAQLDAGLRLEDSPRLKCEKAQALVRGREYRRAAELYDEVLTTTGFVPTSARALALRGRGFAQIELGELDAAEASFRASQEIEPDSPVARNELEYLARLRGGRA